MLNTLVLFAASLALSRASPFPAQSLNLPNSLSTTPLNSLLEHTVECNPPRPDHPMDLSACSVLLGELCTYPMYADLQLWVEHVRPMIFPNDHKSVPPFIFRSPQTPRGNYILEISSGDPSDSQDVFSWKTVVDAAEAVLEQCREAGAGGFEDGIGVVGKWRVQILGTREGFVVEINEMRGGTGGTAPLRGVV